MTNGDKMLKEVGFNPISLSNTLQRFETNETYIRFKIDENKMYIRGNITMEQLKAINEKCIELGMV
jgi:hypothetical protein